MAGSATSRQQVLPPWPLPGWVVRSRWCIRDGGGMAPCPCRPFSPAVWARLRLHPFAACLGLQDYGYARGRRCSGHVNRPPIPPSPQPALLRLPAVQAAVSGACLRGLSAGLRECFPGLLRLCGRPLGLVGVWCGWGFPGARGWRAGLDSPGGSSSDQSVLAAAPALSLARGRGALERAAGRSAGAPRHRVAGVTGRWVVPLRRLGKPVDRLAPGCSEGARAAGHRAPGRPRLNHTPHFGPGLPGHRPRGSGLGGAPQTWSVRSREPRTREGSGIHAPTRSPAREPPPPPLSPSPPAEAGGLDEVEKPVTTPIRSYVGKVVVADLLES